MNLHDLPTGELPRERLIACGAAALSDAELLAILLRTGRRGEHVLDLARGVLGQFKETGLSELLRMPPQEFARIPGIGTAKAATVLAALELGRRVLAAEKIPKRVAGAQDVADVLMPRYRFAKKECMLVLSLSAKNEIITTAEVSTGTLTNTLVHAREVFEPAIRCGAAHIILAHNHPSGDPTPSGEDYKVTRAMKEAGKVLGIPLTDHVIIGHEAYFSFEERGQL